MNDVCVMNDVSCVRERGPALAHAYYAHAKMLHMPELDLYSFLTREVSTPLHSHTYTRVQLRDTA